VAGLGVHLHGGQPTGYLHAAARALPHLKSLSEHLVRVRVRARARVRARVRVRVRARDGVRGQGSGVRGQGSGVRGQARARARALALARVRVWVAGLQGCAARLAAHAQYAPVAALQLDLDRARAHRQLHLANVRMFYVGRLQAAHGTRVRRRRDVRVGGRDRDGA